MRNYFELAFINTQNWNFINLKYFLSNNEQNEHLKCICGFKDQTRTDRAAARDSKHVIHINTTTNLD